MFVFDNRDKQFYLTCMSRNNVMVTNYRLSTVEKWKKKKRAEQQQSKLFDFYKDP
jgi:hypothetical protein